MYAIVRCGGRQEKASVDDVLTVDKMAGEPGSTVTLPAVLVVDDGTVVSDPAEVGRYTVTAEILGTVSGPKINMIHFRSKTGYKRRIGHRQRHTQLKITGITPEGGAAAAGGSARGAAGTRSRAAGTTEEKPAARSRGTGSGRGASGTAGARKAAAGSGTRSSGDRSGRSRPARRATASAGEPDTGGKPDATGQSASGGQES